MITCRTITVFLTKRLLRRELLREVADYWYVDIFSFFFTTLEATVDWYGCFDQTSVPDQTSSEEQKAPVRPFPPVFIHKSYYKEMIFTWYISSIRVAIFIDLTVQNQTSVDLIFPALSQASWLAVI